MKKIVSIAALVVVLITSVTLSASRGFKASNEGTYFITSGCISCGTCAGHCPVEAIFEGEDQYHINPDICVGCGTCMDECPVGAIWMAEAWVLIRR